MGKPIILGISASQRAARLKGTDIISNIKRLQSENDLFAFLEKESGLRLKHYLDAGRDEKRSFLEVYKNLKTYKNGLSNSEAALVAGLWGALNLGNVDIDYLSLKKHFASNGSVKDEKKLVLKILEADCYLISGPVYFGDRSSLAQSFFELLKSHSKIKDHIAGKFFGGIAVGAKRNGGQETTLIYQIMDYLRLGLFAVGNDDKTTSQYGGTCHAGDVGSIHKDSYGINTSIGVGRRLGILIKKNAQKKAIKGPLKVLFLILREKANQALKLVQEIIKEFDTELDAKMINITKKRIARCLACDFCPTHIDVDEVYRCVIVDDMKQIHNELLLNDIIVPVTLSLRKSENSVSNYQQFIERTRYLRRGDYALSNTIIAPLVFEELGYCEDYAVRLVTSFIRHHTIIARPMIGYLQNGKLLNKDGLLFLFDRLIRMARTVSAVKFVEVNGGGSVKYNPVGYVLSADKEVEDERLKIRIKAVAERHKRYTSEALMRISDMS